MKITAKYSIWLGSTFSMIALLVAVAAFATYAQSDVQSDIELLKSDVRAQRVDIVTKTMHFTDAESAAFWPIYKSYEADLDKLADQRIALIKDYANNYDTMTDAKAQSLMEQNFAIEQQRIKLKSDYFARFAKATSPKTAARFIQVDNRLDLLINLQLAEQIPLVK